MKSKIKLLIIVFLTTLVSFSCTNSVDNSLTVRNMAAETIYLNFRGSLITAPSGTTQIRREIPKGRFEYSTIFEIPSGVSNSSTQGPVSGIFDIKAGTNILIVYSSTITEGGGGGGGQGTLTYLLNATVSSSDTVSTSTGGN